MRTSLRMLAEGSTALVSSLEFPAAQSDFARRLMEMGITPGASLTVAHRIALGGTIVIDVRGARLSLRNADAERVLVETAS